MNDLKERSPIIVIEKGILPGVSTTGYVINGTQGLDFQRSGHEGSPSETGTGLQDLNISRGSAETPNKLPRRKRSGY